MLGARIALLRRNCAMSQKALSKALGISASAVGMYEQGRREPSAELLIKMADYFHTTVDYLIGHSDNPAKPLSPNFAESRRMMGEIQQLHKRLPCIDCGSCGSPTCLAFAEDVIRGEAKLEECIILQKPMYKDRGEQE